MMNSGRLEQDLVLGLPVLRCYRNGARFLWKTIPAAIKESQPETVAAWKIGQKLWTRDYAGVHEALRSFDWSREARDLVNSLSNVMQQGWLMDHITGMFTVKKLTVSKEQKVNFDNLQPLSTYSTWSTSTPLHLRGLSSDRRDQRTDWLNAEVPTYARGYRLGAHAPDVYCNVCVQQSSGLQHLAVLSCSAGAAY
ncbi:hypothetical protein SAY87_011450 [Trapa incisa]|uniref:CSN8/PSMD8/EIF3K domain-containing protein n=1 Tax=Trapa incisa TaxID=236973 RepID=A0AAN7GIK6_9MYRT|nr:hypothetical protein SAY87_011450 [Trapa incisa]